MPILEARQATKSFGGLVAVDSVDMAMEKGEVIGLIGPNGAGKTTFFNLVTGMYGITSGELIFNGQPLGKLRPYEITARGIARTFQNIRLFKSMTVLENVLVGQYCRTRSNLWSALARTKAFQKEDQLSRDRALEILEFVGLSHLHDEIAANLSYGNQRRVEIARAMAAEPELLLLDEPAAGMNTQEKKEMLQLIGQIRGKGLSVLLIEHNMRLVMEICDRVVVLDHGAKIAEGTPREIQKNERVIVAYLGKSRSEAGR